MKVVFNKTDLIDATNIVLKAVSSKTTMPILTCILIEAANEEIKMTGNDLELAIETKVSGIISEEGSIAVDAKLFSDIIRKLPEGNITISQVGEVINISCEKSNFNIQGKNAEDFTRFPSIETNEYICISILWC